MSLPNLLNSLTQESDVEVVPDRRNVTALFSAEDVSGPANLHIPHRYAETCSQFGCFLNGFEALLRFLAQYLAWTVEQIGIRPVCTSTDSSTKLVKLSQTQDVCAGNNDRIDIWNVVSALNDRGR